MDYDSQRRLWCRIQDEKDELCGLSLLVLGNHIARLAFGIEIFAAGNLAAMGLLNWFQFAAWCATRGKDTRNMPAHVLLPSLYGWAVHSCAEADDVGKLNRQIFGATKPW